MKVKSTQHPVAQIAQEGRAVCCLHTDKNVLKSDMTGVPECAFEMAEDSATDGDNGCR